MPGLAGNPPGILTPGRGPNGPGPFDCRHAITDVGTGTVPYGPTNGYATPNGVTGFIGPAAGSVRLPITWYIRATGSNTNGGTSSSTTPSRTGTDGVTNGSPTFTSASANFTRSDIGKGICVQSGTVLYAKIISVSSATTVTLSGPASGSASSLSWALDGAWADPRPILGSNVFATNTCGVTTGDTVYIGAGTYRQVYTVGSNLGATFQSNGNLLSATAAYFNGMINIVGDVTGQFTGDAGMVQLTAYTTNDKTAPSATTLLNLNGKSNLAFSNIMFVGGSARIVLYGAAANPGAQNISWVDCAFTSAVNVALSTFSLSANSLIPLAWVFDRCLFFGPFNSTSAQGSILISGNPNATAGQDFGLNIMVKNSVAYCGSSFLDFNTGGSGAKPGGISLRNCSIYTNLSAFQIAAISSTSIPCSINDSLVIAGVTAALNANASGQLLESNNLIYATTPRTNVTAGTGSISDGSYAPLFHFGQERIWLPPLLRAFGEPMAGSPLLGFGNDGAQTPYDLRGALNPRPAGGSSALPAVGALERADTFVTDPSPIGTGTTPVKLTGPGYNDILWPVSASQVGQNRTITVKVQYDSNYSPGTPGLYPAIELISKPQMGVGAQSVSTTAGHAGSPQTLTLAVFAPTAAGVLNIRLVSFDASGTSVVQWDQLTIS